MPFAMLASKCVICACKVSRLVWHCEAAKAPLVAIDDPLYVVKVLYQADDLLWLQQVLARPHWSDRLTPRDQLAITPLIWDHVNPYGRFELDMDSRIPVLT
jgi:hypothetical protein